jgi:hypothetical protein
LTLNDNQYSWNTAHLTFKNNQYSWNTAHFYLVTLFSYICLLKWLLHSFVFFHVMFSFQGSSWSWSYGRWIWNYLSNQCISLLKLWVRIPLIARCTRYNIMW